MTRAPAWRLAWLACWLIAAAPGAARAADAPLRVEDFQDISAWSEHPADGVKMRLGAVGAAGQGAMRFDFEFTRGGGYAVARRAVDLTLPENYAFALRLRGEAPAENLELKLIDDTGENVWWCNRRDFEFPKQWQTLVTKKRQISFAWGPIGGGEIHHVAAIEIAITAGSGGHGTVWLDDLELRPLALPSAPVAPIATASSARPGHPAALAVDGDSTSFWQPQQADRHPVLTLDLQSERELGGLVLDWAPGRRAHGYTIELSSDGHAWTRARTFQGGANTRDYIRLPETDARFIRFTDRDLDRGDLGGPAMAAIRVMPLAWGATPESFLEAVASDAPLGDYPRAFRGQQVYWTVVGLDGDTQEALVSEDGAIEVGKKGFSVEPFLFAGGRLWTWADAHPSASLAEHDLPIPTVHWETSPLDLEVTAFATGARESSSAIATYRVTNRSSVRQQGTLYLAIRPIQVNPPTQFLNIPGGAAPIRRLLREERVIVVNEDRRVIPLTPPSGFGATRLDEDDITRFLRRNQLPSTIGLDDPEGWASGALAYRFELEPRGTRTFSVMLPLHGMQPPPPPARQAAGLAAAALAQATRDWKAAWRGPAVTLPDSAEGIVETLHSQLGYILVNRDSAAIQPGSRSYERSWIRDGALTSAALLRLGRADVVREFLEWFVKYQYESGKVPCCVDRRGGDPTAEHDSGGELIFLVAEYVRYTGDRDLAGRMWPHVRAAAVYLDSLRQQRRTAEYRAPDKREFFGLLPPSISHEGYSAKPMHSYWDDLFALRGFKDAEYLAGVLGLRADAARWARVRAEFERELRASVVATMARHKIDYVPGCADLGDFDATSTTIALNPVQAGAALPPAALRATFERYWTFFEKRRDGREPWEAFTPYEIRNVGAFVRLGWRDRANELLDWFLRYQRPPGFHHWAEVVWHDERAPRFIGDMPHTWVGSDFVRSVLDMLAYEREGDGAIVVGAGVPGTWLDDPAGVQVDGLPTTRGKLDFAMKREGGGVRIRLGGALQPPRGGLVLAPPGVTAAWKATVDGAPVPVTRDGDIVVRKLPATVRVRP